MKVAVTVVLDATTLLTLILDPKPFTPVVPDRPVPVNVTLTVSPGYADAGLMAVIVAAAKAGTQRHRSARLAETETHGIRLEI